MSTVEDAQGSAAADAEVLVRTEGALGWITLNRPRALNALNVGMIRVVHAALDAWRDDSDVEIVYIDGAGERGLCAGGDVRELHRQITAGRSADTVEFFREEYAMNAAIAEYPKPIVAIADGITMGGGIGVAGHAAIRVVTERSQLAMPEVRIGFTPDVGGTWLLGRAPGRLGEFLALTAGTMNGSDALYAGFADFWVPSERLDALRDALAHRADPTGPSEIVMLFDETPDPSPLSMQRAWIDEAFSAGTVPEIIADLRAVASSGAVEGEETPQPLGPTAADTADLLESLAPTALVVTLDAVREARAMESVRDALAGEYRRVLWFVHHHPDLVEGIRAQLVDKDRDPHWDPQTLADLAPDAGADARDYVPPIPLWS
ncbi:enoyl-CoA hydratase/isomerase family protein [Microbacterium sp. Au-Mic1]|uniref:enoyl-CoA hydratase/isomerase family protein n=1 Tax=Microbacterium sp. Au-Mic1 TaxID=2906457 RepID=UPI001E60EB30|nr:enoyl-CoA hydratase/isomerase family protein [Microbacterium sp. Au-Mic1]MCE4027706.1 enoyl-CoA hydratase/isomerase family protein [Microbacterium sp. Au-Mic1]